jgi:hypothetical protein
MIEGDQNQSRQPKKQIKQLKWSVFRLLEECALALEKDL